MSLRLTLTRHAKSDWDDPRLDDHDRPLNARGYEAANAIGGWIKQHDYCAQTVLCSTAQRTRETWAEITKACGNTDVQFFSELYLASPGQMFAILQGCKTQTAMMLAHNPGTAMLAEILVKTPPKHSKFMHYPTAATTVIEFETGSWADIQPNSGTVLDFIVPRDLTD